MKKSAERKYKGIEEQRGRKRALTEHGSGQKKAAGKRPDKELGRTKSR